jgi:V-type H+-transporting ATPase subunit a
MFGDFGHGIVLAIVGGLLLLWEKRLENAGLTEMARTMFDGRYVIFLMGLFSIYVGLIYNETFAVPMNLFGSNWEFEEHSTSGKWNWEGKVYPFGVDPKWKEAGNDLTYYNSLKMKLSIILGVSQVQLSHVLPSSPLLSSLHPSHFSDIFFTSFRWFLVSA